MERVGTRHRQLLRIAEALLARRRCSLGSRRAVLLAAVDLEGLA